MNSRTYDVRSIELSQLLEIYLFFYFLVYRWSQLFDIILSLVHDSAVGCWSQEGASAELAGKDAGFFSSFPKCDRRTVQELPSVRTHMDSAADWDFDQPAALLTRISAKSDISF